MTPEQNQLRARLGNHVRNNPDNVVVADELRRELKASRLADHIRKTVASAPALTPAQMDRLALLFQGGDAA